jgi:hypothetical protein
MIPHPVDDATPPRAAEFVEVLRERYAAAQTAPSNKDICKRFKLKSVSSAAALVYATEVAGVIVVERRQRGRLFSFVAANSKNILTFKSANITDQLHDGKSRKRKAKP